MKKPNSTLLVLVLASLIGLYILSKAFNYKYKQTETISVTGAADTNFVSDMIVWSGSFSRTSLNMQEAFDALKKDEVIVMNYLQTKGLSKEERKKKFKYYCDKCDFGTYAEILFTRHCETKKHLF